MSIRLITIILIVCTSCQSGIIPCPKVKTAKLHKSFKPSASSLTERVNPEPEAATRKMKDAKINDGHFIQNISVEEWDCPKPGKKKYMPKSVKENIRRNKKKIESDFKENAADSLSNR
ncbi:MAG: hypothetical protein C0490_06380 [Marivirga sp.]|nr:hypothetical protein [Marivirga sp.]